MAKIKEELIVVKVSTLVKDDAGESATVFGDEIVSALEDVISELVGNGHVVEITKD